MPRHSSAEFEAIARHNREMMDRHAVPEAARRGVRAAADHGESYIIEIRRRERAGGGVYLLVFTSWRRESDRAEHCWIVGPRGKATKGY